MARKFQFNVGDIVRSKQDMQSTLFEIIAIGTEAVVIDLITDRLDFDYLIVWNARPVDLGYITFTPNSDKWYLKESELEFVHKATKEELLTHWSCWVHEIAHRVE